METVARKTEELIGVLRQMTAILGSDGVTGWRDWALRAEALLASGDFSGIGYVLRAYGGNSSLSDLALGHTTPDGVFVWNRELHERFHGLRARAWVLAEGIKRRGALR